MRYTTNMFDWTRSTHRVGLKSHILHKVSQEKASITITGTQLHLKGRSSRTGSGGGGAGGQVISSVHRADQGMELSESYQRLGNGSGPKNSHNDRKLKYNSEK